MATESGRALAAAQALCSRPLSICEQHVSSGQAGQEHVRRMGGGWEEDGRRRGWEWDGSRGIRDELEEGEAVSYTHLRAHETEADL
eukprot:2493790-Rhodomonas_salina.1